MGEVMKKLGDPLTPCCSLRCWRASDVAGRIIAQRMSEILGQQVVVDNPSGESDPNFNVRERGSDADMHVDS